MGTSYKGNTKFFRSIGQNAMIVANKFPYKDGYFGISSPSTGNKTRNIVSDNPADAAKAFYDKIALGGIEETYDNGSKQITSMADGTIITYREKSRSDGTPVCEINIKYSSHTGGIKQQKIHFIEG